MTAPIYKPRSWWADSSWARGGAQLVATDLWREGNVNHYPGRASAFGIMTPANLRSNLRGWWNYHVNGRGWSDIGYQMAVSMTTEGPYVVDLRGIGRVPAAHASASNPRANWHGGATLWTIGNTEKPHPELIEAYRHFRHNVWLKRWPTATGVTGHRLVPGTSTGCPGDPLVALIRSGTLKLKPSTIPPVEEDMPITDAEWTRLSTLITTKVRAEITAALNTPIKRTWSNVETSVAPADGGRYAFFANSNADLAARRAAAIEALVAKLVADGANNLTAEQVKEIIESAVIKVDVTIQGEQVAPPLDTTA